MLIVLAFPLEFNCQLMDTGNWNSTWLANGFRYQLVLTMHTNALVSVGCLKIYGSLLPSVAVNKERKTEESDPSFAALSTA